MANNDIREWSLPGPAALLMDAKDVSKFFGVSVDTIRDWIARGKFPCGLVSGGEQTWTGLDIAAYLHLRGRLSAIDEKSKGKQTD